MFFFITSSIHHSRSSLSLRRLITYRWCESLSMARDGADRSVARPLGSTVWRRLLLIQGRNEIFIENIVLIIKRIEYRDANVNRVIFSHFYCTKSVFLHFTMHTNFDRWNIWFYIQCINECIAKRFKNFSKSRILEFLQLINIRFLRMLCVISSFRLLITNWWNACLINLTFRIWF